MNKNIIYILYIDMSSKDLQNELNNKLNDRLFTTYDVEKNVSDESFLKGNNNKLTKCPKKNLKQSKLKNTNKCKVEVTKAHDCYRPEKIDSMTNAFPKVDFGEKAWNINTRDLK